MFLKNSDLMMILVMVAVFFVGGCAVDPYGYGSAPGHYGYGAPVYTPPLVFVPLPMHRHRHGPPPAHNGHSKHVVPFRERGPHEQRRFVAPRNNFPEQHHRQFRQHVPAQNKRGGDHRKGDHR